MLALLFALALLVAGAAAGPIPVLALEGSVDPGSADYLVAGIRQAEAEGAPAIVITMDTPGGLLSSAREIVQAELSARIPVVVYVTPSGARAGSAGVPIALAAHVVAMAPGTTIGAAHPVDLFGGGLGGGEEGEEERQADEVMSEKVLNDMLAWMKAIAEQRGRPLDFAEEAVRTSAAITDSEALARGVVDLVAPDLPSLLGQLDGRSATTAAGPIVLRTAGVPTAPRTMGLRQAAVHFLGDPNVIFLLIGLGLLGLYVEYHNPGLIVPGALGAAALIAAAVALSIVPFNGAGLLLVAAGFGFFAAELWVPSYGALTLSGILCLVLGGILLFDVQDFDLRVQPLTLIAVSAFTGGLALAVGALVLRSQRRRACSGREGLIGEIGEVTAGGAGGGWVLVDGAQWRATWAGDLAVGCRVRVRASQRLQLEVEPVVPEAPPPREP